MARVTRRIPLVTLLAAVLASTPHAIAQTSTPTAPSATSHDARLTPEVVSLFMANYYRAPEPNVVPSIIQAAINSGLLEQQSRRMPVIAFMAGLIATDPTFVNRLAPLFEKLPGEQPMRLTRAIIYSGRPDWSLHTARLKNMWPTKADEIETLASKGGRSIPHLKTEGNPLVIDMNWAYFGATGHRDAVEKVIAALPTALDGSNAQVLLTAQSAKWSLTSNAAQHPLVLDICHQHRTGPHGEQLKEVITAAEARLNKAAPKPTSPKSTQM
ncbi:MAG: hypothetical protein ABL898_00730 [Hyphomicrobiaceae bacterium]